MSRSCESSSMILRWLAIFSRAALSAKRRIWSGVISERLRLSPGITKTN